MVKPSGKLRRDLFIPLQSLECLEAVSTVSLCTPLLLDVCDLLI
jgi:hypothetical protein